MTKRVLTTLLALLVVSTASAATTHYVSNSSTASSPCTAQAPCQPSEVWLRVNAGDVVVFKNGVYTGEDYMLDPPSSRDGTLSLPITVRAETDGGVRIDGEGQWIPVEMYANKYYIIEGFNAHASSGTVYRAISGNHLTFKRCVGWDAADTNSSIFVPGNNALVEDCAAFGIARKTYNTHEQDDVTFRRIWGRWEGSTHTGPKIVIDSFYFNSGTRVENALLTWNNGSMPHTWHTNDGTNIISGPYTGWQSGNPRGTISQGQIHEGEECVDVKIHGTVSYLKGQTDGDFNAFGESRALVDYKTIRMQPCCLTLENIATWIDPANDQWNSNLGFNLGDGCTAQSPKQLFARDISQVQSSSSNFHADWSQTDVEAATDTAGLGDSIYEGNGAHICFRYENGATTNEPLWPWPMQQRILDATTFAAAPGHTHLITRCVEGNTPECALRTVNTPHAVANVMADVVQMFGSPPTQCSSDGNSNGDAAPPPPADIWRTDTSDD